MKEMWLNRKTGDFTLIPQTDKNKYVLVLRGVVEDVYTEIWDVCRNHEALSSLSVLQNQKMRLGISYSKFEYYDTDIHNWKSQDAFIEKDCSPYLMLRLILPPEKFDEYWKELEKVGEVDGC